MRTLIALGLVLFLSLITGSAHAGGYVSLGISADNSQTTPDTPQADMTISRLAVGHRLGPWAVEARAFGNDTSTMAGETSSMALGVGVKLHLGLLGPMEGFVHAGVHQAWITDGDSEYTGYGYDYGGGLQLAFRLIPVLHGAVWVDYTRQAEDEYRIADAMPGADTDGMADMLTVGVTLGHGL